MDYIWYREILFGNDNIITEVPRVSTPTALETMLPWKRTDEGEMNTGPLKQSEFPAWCSNKEYLAYSSPSATFLGKSLHMKHMKKEK